jgi:hypothetical protein
VIVRGWLMIGGLTESYTLPPEKGVGWFVSGVRPASDFRPGDWAMWAPSSGVMPVCLVCVEVPVG